MTYFPDIFIWQFTFERLGFWENHEYRCIMCVFVKQFSFYLLLVSLRVGEESQNPMDHFSSQVGNTLQLFHYFHLQRFKKQTVVSPHENRLDVHKVMLLFHWEFYVKLIKQNLMPCSG